MEINIEHLLSKRNAKVKNIGRKLVSYKLKILTYNKKNLNARVRFYAHFFFQNTEIVHPRTLFYVISNSLMDNMKTS